MARRFSAKAIRDALGGVDRVMDALVDQAAAQDGRDNALRSAALVAVTELKLTLSQPGTGRSYRRGGRTHVASAPGQPPARDTGKLVGSIDMESVGPGVIAVGTDQPYGADLEDGTVTAGGLIAPRPWMKPTIDRIAPQMREVFGVTLGAAVRKAVP